MSLILSNVGSDIFHKVASVGKLDLFLNLLWLVWTNRNSCLHDSFLKNPKTLGLSAQTTVVELFSRQNAVTALREPNAEVMRWEHPYQGWTKISVDAAYADKDFLVGLGIVARDHDGIICFSANAQIDNVHSPLHAEMKAIVLRLELAKDFGSGKLN
ncbi:hypothetical protein REPUB_Repub04eG0212300 [Reevesia pubescens]